jgi:hypothetical protein
MVSFIDTAVPTCTLMLTPRVLFVSQDWLQRAAQPPVAVSGAPVPVQPARGAHLDPGRGPQVSTALCLRWWCYLWSSGVSAHLTMHN